MKTPPCLLHEDDHLLVVNKPAGLNTHAPHPHAGEGLYDWLRHREPRWASLAIIHRLDKETSGVLIFSKSTLANRSLTQQFERHEARKKYLFLTDRQPAAESWRIESALKRSGDKYVSHPWPNTGERAETHFQVIRRQRAKVLIEARPVTGRTHQIRVHAAGSGLPIMGDTLYGGTPAERVFLHAEELVLIHPATGALITFHARPDFQTWPRLALRRAQIDDHETNAYRLIHGAADGFPDWYVDRWGDYLLSQAASPLTDAQHAFLDKLRESLGMAGAYHKILSRQVRQSSPVQVSPQWVLGARAPEEFMVRENEIQFLIRFQEGYSVGLFLDQRENRRRLLAQHVAAGFPLFARGRALKGQAVLNLFAYTCGFSVCAAQAGAQVTSVDLSRKYLAWGQRNFALNGLDIAGHEFLEGDVFDWLRRWRKKAFAYDAILMDPPTFSTSKQQGTFQAERDYSRLLTAALHVLKPGGILFAATNAAKLSPESFLKTLHQASADARREILQCHYVPQPADFPMHADEPAYLKTVWLRVS